MFCVSEYQFEDIEDEKKSRIVFNVYYVLCYIIRNKRI